MISTRILITLFIFNTAILFGQRPVSDTFVTNDGALIIQPILHGTLSLSYNGKVIYVDPYGGAKAFEGMPKPDLILITDIHGDHLNKQTLDTINTEGTIFVVPQAVADELSDKYKAKLHIMANGEKIEQWDMTIEAMPMYNLPESADAKHVKGRGNGYVLTIDNKRIYISGDTADIQEMRALEDIDIAFVCMNLPYTMSIDQASSAVLDFKPKIVYPYHYRGNPDMSDTKAFKKLVNDQDQDIDVRLRDWYGVDQ